MPSHPVVHIVDDDQGIRRSVAQLLVTEGFDVKTYPSANDFVAEAPPDVAGCLITDVRMPGMSGVELLSYVREHGLALHVILLTAYADVQMAVLATKKGAADVLEKPFRAHTLIEAVRHALAERLQPTVDNEKAREAQARFSALTAREREVMDQVVVGLQNKIIAHELGISHRTVEIHRARIMKKAQVRSFSELVKLYLSAKA